MAARYKGVERRKGYAEMTAMIAEESDPKLRALLAAISSMFGRLEEKLDAALADEQALRAMVLNGHSDTHEIDHDHVAQCRESGCLEVCERMRERFEKQDKAQEVVDEAQIKEKFSVRTAVWTSGISVGGTLLVSYLLGKGVGG